MCAKRGGLCHTLRQLPSANELEVLPSTNQSWPSSALVQSELADQLALNQSELALGKLLG